MMSSEDSKYDANFTAGGLLLNEFLAIEPILLSDNYKEQLKSEIEENSIIGINTKSARQRIIAEIIRRVSMVPKSFWNHFYAITLNEQKLALLYLCFKTYPLIFDVHFEVAVKKYKTGGTLTDYDIQMRLDEIASSDEYVAGWSESTFKKINVQYRKALKEAGLFKKNGNLVKSTVDNQGFWNYYKGIGDNWFLTACFIQN